jgi:hypothetical protein
MLTPVLGLARDDAHVYSAFYPPAPAIVLPSVTTVIDVLAKHALYNWYPKQSAEFAVDNAAWLQLAAALDRDAAVKAVAERGKLERDRRGGIGTRTHQAIEALLAGLPVIADADTAPLVAQYRRFAREWSFRPTWSEAMVCILTYGYAGTFDLYGELGPRRHRALIDIKTGGYIAADFGLQLAAYGAADFIGKPGTTDRWKLPVVDLYAVLQLAPDGYRLIPYDVGNAELNAFLAALVAYRWTRAEGRKVIGQDLALTMLAA